MSSLPAENQKKQKAVKVGDKLPSFSLPDEDGKLFCSDEYVGKHILVIFFYPKDESRYCTEEACSFRDSFVEFSEAGAVVVGINNGSMESHRHFKALHHLPYNLLTDTGNVILKKFGVQTRLISTGRETFIVDFNGIVVHKHNSYLNGRIHAEKALEVIRGLRSASI
ncbi:MAG TPA: peroxiredoxin [Bacteroidia bacterium]|jgi:peroxiredoxin Q/BCP|nr:peroxiredoxin [Bacteroidia bacterium]